MRMCRVVETVGAAADAVTVVDPAAEAVAAGRDLWTEAYGSAGLSDQAQ